MGLSWTNFQFNLIFFAMRCNLGEKSKKLLKTINKKVIKITKNGKWEIERKFHMLKNRI